jgi:hypothetical protein
MSPLRVLVLLSVVLAAPAGAVPLTKPEQACVNGQNSTLVTGNGGAVGDGGPGGDGGDGGRAARTAAAPSRTTAAMAHPADRAVTRAPADPAAVEAAGR